MVDMGNDGEVAKGAEIHDRTHVTHQGGRDSGPLAILLRLSRERGLNTVANIKSQKKRILTNRKAAERNKAVRSELKTRVKSAISAVSSGAENADDALRQAVKRIDKAATKGVIHKNAAARRKSRLMRQVNQTASAED
jgi:small subunit ribosomal protein S20